MKIDIAPVLQLPAAAPTPLHVRHNGVLGPDDKRVMGQYM
jgi:hypothetical protein